MKTSLFILVILLCSHLSFSQIGDNLLSKTKVISLGEHQHDGFYLSMCLGVAGGSISYKEIKPQTNSYEFSGSGAILDFKLGGAVSENLYYMQH